MLETMYEGSGIGLAATQVNVHKRVIVLDVSETKDEPLILINPKVNNIIDPNKKTFSEGCLSVPGFYEELKKLNKMQKGYKELIIIMLETMFLHFLKLMNQKILLTKLQVCL